MSELKYTIGEVASLRLALSVTRYWTLQIANELELWVDYAEAGGDHHPKTRALLEQWRKQSEILANLVPLEEVTEISLTEEAKDP